MCFASNLSANGIEDSGVSQKSDNQLLEEIIVTARKRSENLLEVPLSIVKLNAQELERSNISSLLNLDSRLGNVAIGGSGGLGSSNAAFYIRGIGTSRNAINQEPAVAVYIDDSYYGRSDDALLSLMDISSIEVLRGPQGTLFGRNATAGAIRYITQPPQDYTSGKLKLTLGSNNKRDVAATLNAPISPAMDVRVSAMSLNQDGHVIGALTNLDYGNINTDALRLSNKWRISESAFVTFAADHSQKETHGAPSILLNINPSSPFVTQEANAGFDITSIATGDFRQSFQTGANYYRAKNTGAAFTAGLELNNGNQLKSVTTYRSLDVEGAYDTDGSFASLFEQEYVRELSSASQEFNYSGDTHEEKLEWLLGAYFFKESASDIRQVYTTVNSVNRSNTRIVDPITTMSQAFFGQATLALDSKWRLTSGLRYNSDKKKILANELNSAGVPIVDDVEREDIWSDLSGRISLDRKIRQHSLIYVSYAKGFRAGGFNDRIRTDLASNYSGITTFDQETLHTYELGIHAELLNHQLRFNGTIFSSQYNDIQLASILPGTSRTVIQNAGEAKLSGFEGNIKYRPAHFFQLNLSLNYLSTEYSNLNENVTSVSSASAFPRAPNWAYHIGATFYARNVQMLFDYGWQDEFRTVVGDADYVQQAAYGLLNINVDYTLNKHWRISGYGNNVLDEEYLVSGLNLDTGKPFGIIQAEPGRFKEFGIKFSYEY